MATNNSVTLYGNLGEAPATHTGKNGPFVTLRLATTDSYKDEQTGEWRDLDAVWHSVFAFGDTVSGYARSFKKGDRLEVKGKLTYRTTKVTVDGQPRYCTEASIVAYSIKDARLPRKANTAPTSQDASPQQAVNF